MPRAPVSLGGIAKVYCIHDREKRLVKNPDEVVQLGREIGVKYDPKKHKIQLCPCCANCFVTEDDTPKLCAPCNGIPVHQLMASLPQPNGVFDE